MKVGYFMWNKHCIVLSPSLEKKTTKTQQHNYFTFNFHFSFKSKQNVL